MAKRHKTRKTRRTTNQIKKYKNKPSQGLFGAIQRGIADSSKKHYEDFEKKTDNPKRELTSEQKKKWYWR